MNYWVSSPIIRWGLLLGGTYGAALSNTPPLIDSPQHVIIHRNAGEYSAFPALYRLNDGSLYIRLTAGVTNSHLEPRQKTLRFRSGNGGLTWEQTEGVEWNPAFASSRQRLVHAHGYGWRYAAPSERANLEAQGIEVRESPEGQITYAYGCFVKISDDGGTTWIEREIPVPPKGLIMAYSDAATLVRLDSRTLLRAVYGRPEANVPFYESRFIRSEDDGMTWNFGTIAADAKKEIGYGETAIVEAANGDIVAMIRQEPATGTRMWTARSRDRGKTWSPPVQTKLQGHPAHLLRLADGNLLCSYGYRNDPIGIRAALSRDHGNTWREEDIVVLRSGGSGRPGDNGYPVSAENADGSLFTVYYFTYDGITGVEGTRWRLQQK